mgnify:CR=1 FL=1
MTTEHPGQRGSPQPEAWLDHVVRVAVNGGEHSSIAPRVVSRFERRHAQTVDGGLDAAFASRSRVVNSDVAPDVPRERGAPVSPPASSAVEKRAANADVVHRSLDTNRASERSIVHRRPIASQARMSGLHGEGTASDDNGHEVRHRQDSPRRTAAPDVHQERITPVAAARVRTRRVEPGVVEGDTRERVNEIDLASPERRADGRGDGYRTMSAPTAPPAVSVTIDRLEIRTPAAAPPVAAPRTLPTAARGPRLTLDEYLKRREGRSV